MQGLCHKPLNRVKSEQKELRVQRIKSSWSLTWLAKKKEKHPQTHWLDNWKVLMIMKAYGRKPESACVREGRLMLYTSSSPFTCFLSVWLSVKLIMDYSGGKQVLPLFFHKKKTVGWKRLGGKNGRGDGRVDGSSIEKKEEDRLFTFSWKRGRWIVRWGGGMNEWCGWRGRMDRVVQVALPGIMQPWSQVLMSYKSPGLIFYSAKKRDCQVNTCPQRMQKHRAVCVFQSLSGGWINTAS